MSKIKGGYYIKARCIQESVIQHAPPHFREIWDWLLKEANHQDNKYGKFTVKRGQCFRSYKDIRDGLSWNVGYRKERYSENQTKKAMKFLRENLMIDTAKELGGVLITICNYEHYQNPKNYEGTKEGTNERTNEEPMRNQGGTDNNKNVKNGKNVKKDIKTFLSDSTEYRLAELLFTEIKKNNPDHKQPNLQTWSKHIDLLMRVDSKQSQDIDRVIKWVQADNIPDSKGFCWAFNVLSTAKLREQFDQLTMRMGGQKPNKDRFKRKEERV